MRTCFQLPPLLTLADYREQLADHCHLEEIARSRCQRVWLDSADHRLFHAGLALHVDKQGKKRTLTLIDRDHGTSVQTVVDTTPKWPADIPDAQLAERLAGVLKLRALLPLASQKLTLHQWRLLNSDDKGFAWLHWEEDGKSLPLAILSPLRGYQKPTKKLAKSLQQNTGLLPLAEDNFARMLEQQQLRPGTYSNKIRACLDPDMRADQAMAEVLIELLEMMRFNEAGLIADIDTEFLHDFRIGIRKSRSLIAQSRGILSAREQARARRTLTWLASITSHKRDVDVYLLDFPRIAAMLPESDRPHLQALHALLEKEQQLARGKLKRSLGSRRYTEFMRDWGQRLAQMEQEPARGERADEPILQVASDNIWRLYRKLRRDGSRIDDDSPIDALHELRKTGKKLRYLIEAYASLYPADRLEQCLLDMKQLQDALGTITDLDVQRHLLQEWQERLAQQHSEAEAGQALLQIAKKLQQREQKKRVQFGAHFARFHEQEIHQRFRQLFRITMSQN